MKKIKLLKAAVLLFTIVAFVNCDDSDIQFQVKDDFDAIIPVVGLNGQSSYTSSTDTNLSDLLDNASTFVDADVESVTLSLENYSGGTIEGSITLTLGTIQLFTVNNLSLSSTTPRTITIPAAASNILSLISSNTTVPVSITGTTISPIEDDNNNFNINAVITVKATVE